LEPGKYFLYVSRMEPENNPLLVVKAFELADINKNLVMVGGAPYAANYIRKVKRTTDARILFTGPLYGNSYDELQSHCKVYIHATEVGGTHPALIEAMGRGVSTLFLNTPENFEVAGNIGWAFPNNPQVLARLIEQIDALPQVEREKMGRRALKRVRERYNWERVVDHYEDLFHQIITPSPP